MMLKASLSHHDTLRRNFAGSLLKGLIPRAHSLKRAEAAMLLPAQDEQAAHSLRTCGLVIFSDTPDGLAA